MSLGGLMFWSVDNDDFRGDCHGKPYPLVEAGKEELLRLAGPPSKGTSKGPSRVGGSSISSSSGNRRRPGSTTGGGRKRRPSTTSTTTTTTTTTTPSYGSLSTPEPPTTPDPGSDFVCKDEGFFPHPRDCKKYFWCLDSGPSSLGIVAHQFTCPSGLYFNKAADSCDYSRNVLCKKKLAESTSTTTKAPATSAGTTTTRRTTARTTTTTTTTTTEAPEYEEYDEEGEEEDGSLEEDPSALKELIGLIKKLGGLKELERQLEPSNSGSKGTTSSPINKGSSSLYERVLGSRGKRPPPVLNARRPPPPATSTASSIRPTLKYVSLRRERPAKVESEEQEEEFDDEEVEEEVAPKEEIKTRKQNTGNTRVFTGERPKYVTINRPRPSTTPTPPEEEDEEEEVDGIERDPEPEVGTPRYVTINRPRPTRVSEPEISTPRYQIIDRRHFGSETPQEKTSEKSSEKPDVEEKATTIPSTTSTPIHSSSFSSIAASASPSLLSSPNSPSSIYSTTTAPATVTRVITSVTEAATERQVIAVARVPYSVLLGARAANNKTTETTTVSTTTTEKAISTSRRPLFAPRGNALALGRRRVTTRRKILVPSTRLGDEKTEPLTSTVLAAAPLVGEERKIPAIRGTVRQKDITPDVVIGGKGIDDIEEKREGDIFEEGEEVIVEVTSQKPATVRRPTVRRPASPRPTSSRNSPRTTVTSLPRRLSTTRRPTPPPSEDDDYEYFDLPAGVTSEKVRIRVDGTVQCLDRGNFPHPLAFRGDDNSSPSCNRRFVSCAEVEGNILGWEYECPRHLTFDPIGGICNWAPEGLGCD